MQALGNDMPVHVPRKLLPVVSRQLLVTRLFYAGYTSSTMEEHSVVLAVGPESARNRLAVSSNSFAYWTP